MTATVYASQGQTVNMRNRPDLHASLVSKVPVRSTVNVISSGAEWCQISYEDKSGYMMTKFLKIKEDTDEMILVSRQKLQEIYNMIGELLANK